MAKGGSSRFKRIKLREGRKRPLTAVWKVLGALAVAAAGLFAVCFGVAKGLEKLTDLSNEQCVVSSVGDKITVNTGLLVKRGTILAHFDLTNGVNLARVPFEKKRKEFLDLFKQVRDIRIERRGVDRLVIDVEERLPVARVMSMSTKTPGTRVADVEGYVFNYPRSETALLPIVRDPTTRIVRPGGRLTGMAGAGVRLAQAARVDFPDLGIVDINTSSPYCLQATLSSGAVARIAWQDMTLPSEPSEASVKSMRRQLERLQKAIATGLSPNTTVWTATDWADVGRVMANDPARAE